MTASMPPDPFEFVWANVCRTCESETLVNGRGYCSRDCENEDVLSGWTDERSYHGIEVG